MKNRCYFERCNAKVASVFESYKIKRDTLEERSFEDGTVKYYAQIHLQVWQNSVCTGQGNLPLIT